MLAIDLRFRLTKFVLSTLLVLCYFSMSGFCHANEFIVPNGTWVVKSIYKTSNIQGPSVEEQVSLLGTLIILSPDFLQSCGQSVPVKSVVVADLSSSEFLAGTNVRFQDLNLRLSRVTEVVINNRELGSCFGAFPLPGQDIYIRNRNEIIVSFEGVFYRAIKVR